MMSISYTEAHSIEDVMLRIDRRSRDLLGVVWTFASSDNSQFNTTYPSEEYLQTLMQKHESLPSSDDPISLPRRADLPKIPTNYVGVKTAGVRDSLVKLEQTLHQHGAAKLPEYIEFLSVVRARLDETIKIAKDPDNLRDFSDDALDHILVLRARLDEITNKPRTFGERFMSFMPFGQQAAGNNQ